MNEDVTSAIASAVRLAPTIRSCATGSSGNASLTARKTRDDIKPNSKYTGTGFQKGVHQNGGRAYIPLTSCPIAMRARGSNDSEAVDEGISWW
jgi:hypothetical protein